MGRRVEKKAYDGQALTTHLKFVYDGFKLIEELNGADNNAPLRRYTWQPLGVGWDLPCWMSNSGDNFNFYYITDVNKNIRTLTDDAGTHVGYYEYTPFGDIHVNTAIIYESNSFQSSSEYFDTENRLSYYNFRYYSPRVGKWNTRDTINENGGVNLYVICQNNLINYYDIYGLIKCCSVGEINQCLGVKNRFESSLKDLKDDIDRYDPIEDEKGGHPTVGGRKTKPGGHKQEIQERLKGLQKKIESIERCLEKCNNLPSDYMINSEDINYINTQRKVFFQQ